MYSSRLVHLCMVVISIMALGHAAWFDLGLFGRSVNMLEARQNTGTTSSRSTSSTSSAGPTSSSSQPGSTSTPVSSSSVISSLPPTSSSVSIPTSTPPPSSSSIPSSSQAPASTSQPPSSVVSSSSEQPGPVTTMTSYVVVETTDAAGSKSTFSTMSTFTQSLPQNGGGGAMTDGVKNIIIGVCVGVGGAIVLVVAGLLFWRLRNKKRQQDDHDELAGTSQFNHGQDKSDHSGSTSGRSPFQSTLESYHAPTQTNTASNF